MIGDEAFSSGTELRVTNVPHLRTLEIGSGCFYNASVLSLGRARQPSE